MRDIFNLAPASKAIDEAFFERFVRQKERFLVDEVVECFCLYRATLANFSAG